MIFTCQSAISVTLPLTFFFDVFQEIIIHGETHVAQHAGVAGEVVPDEAFIAEPVQAFMQLVTRLRMEIQ